MFSKPNYFTRLRMIEVAQPYARLSLDELTHWYSFICPHAPPNEAAAALLGGKSIACPGVHVANVYHVLRIVGTNLPGVVHPPRLHLDAPRHFADESSNRPLFAAQAVEYASQHWHDSLLSEAHWKSCLLVFSRRIHSLPAHCVAAMILRHELVAEDGLLQLDGNLINLIPAGVSLHIPELEAAAAALMNKQWFCVLLCPDCGCPHFGDCNPSGRNRSQPICIRSAAQLI